MTPEKKEAIRLVNRYMKSSFNCTDCNMPYCDVPCTRLSIYEAKECALITVDEIKKAKEKTHTMIDRSIDMFQRIFDSSINPITMRNMIEDIEFYKQVKEEIEKL